MTCILYIVHYLTYSGELRCSHYPAPKYSFKGYVTAYTSRVELFCSVHAKEHNFKSLFLFVSFL